MNFGSLGTLFTGALVFIVHVLLITSTAGADEVTIVADEWCPYNCSPSDERKGILIEIAEAIFQRSGRTVKYSLLPWARAIDDARAGKYDAIVGASKSDAPDFIYPDEPPAFSADLFVVPEKSSWRFTGIDSLEKISIGVIQDYSYGQMLDEYIAAQKGNRDRIQIASGDEGLKVNLRKLFAGRVDAIVENKLVIEWMTKKDPQLKTLQIAGTAAEGTGVYVAFSPKDKQRAAELAEIFSRELKSLKASGELERIQMRYR